MLDNITNASASRLSLDRAREAFETSSAKRETPFRSSSPFAISTAFLFYWPSYHLAQKTPSNCIKNNE
jgi:hypothetical protein